MNKARNEKVLDQST